MAAPRPLPLPTPAPRPSRESCTLLTIPQAGELLNLSRDSVYDLIHAGSLKAVLVKGKFRVRLTDLHAFVRHLT
jgi:excisionase family DNA binding protein